MSSNTRRQAICETALDLAASGGNRAVTHHAIDDRLGIARGSTSYYYRTRRELLDAAIDYLSDTSRGAFQAAVGARSDRSAPGNDADAAEHAADVIAQQLDLLLSGRRRDALARYALAADSVGDENRSSALARCLFSPVAAEALMARLGAPDAAQAGADLISLLEGLLFDRLHGARALPNIAAGTAASLADLRPVIVRWLTALSR